MEARRAPGSSEHTIVLVEFGTTLGSRTFLDYSSLAAAYEGVIQLFEKQLSADTRAAAGISSAAAPHIAYGMSELNAFLDSLVGVSLLVWHEASGAYVARSRDWLKQSLEAHLRKQVAERAFLFDTDATGAPGS